MDIRIYYSNDSLDSKRLVNMLLYRLKGYRVTAKHWLNVIILMSYQFMTSLY